MEAPRLRAFAARVRQPVALIAWLYVLVKVFVFDVDVYLLGFVWPGGQWILNFRLLIIGALTALLWLVLGHREFAKFTGYVIGYPFILVFWKFPIFMWRRWGGFIIVTPMIYSAARSLRTTFVLFVGAAISAVLLLFATGPYLLVPAMVYVFIFLVAVIIRAFRNAHSPSVFSQLADLVRRYQPRIENGEWDFIPTTVMPQDADETEDSDDTHESQQAVQIYTFYAAADYISRKVHQVAEEQKYNLVVVASFLTFLILVALDFTFLNWGLYRLDPSSFAGAGDASVFKFFAYSLGQLVTADIVAIHPLGNLAVTLAILEIVCSVLIVVIGVFSFFTIMRNTYQEGFGGFDQALRDIAGAFDDRISVRFFMTSSELELRIARTNIQFVNLVRRIRGLSEFDEPNEPTDPSSDTVPSDSWLGSIQE